MVETGEIEEFGRFQRHIQACSDLGVGISIDDFGTGYSSLNYVRRMPAASLKIDQSFVRDMLDDPDDLAIVETILALARAFHRDVVAEGVETAEHGASLLRLGCELAAQGYGIARPMAAALVPQWVTRWCADPAWASTPVLDRERLMLLFAQADYRSWMRQLAAQRNLEADDASVVVALPQRLLGWVETDAALHCLGAPIRQRIADLARRVHAAVAAASMRAGSGQDGEAAAHWTRANELHRSLHLALQVGIDTQG